MKVGVISDTHISYAVNIRYSIDENIKDSKKLCDVLEPYFADVEAVIHSGDIIDMSVIEGLERFGRVYAVAGNMDALSTRMSLGEKRIIELAKFRIGIIHGWGAKEGLSAKVRQKFQNEKIDCIVFGHSHHPYDRIEDNILMFNPGSPTEKRFSDKRSIGILHLEDTIWGEHIFLD